MKLLVFGKTGQVARELARLAPDATFLGRDKADLCDPAVCAATIARTPCVAVINAAAYTAVDAAEDDEATAQIVNAEAPKAMAMACAARGVPFVHVSTDYVFDGTGNTPRKPEDPTGPLGAYGRTKLAGEEAVRAAGGPHAILRTSWVFSAHGSNFVKTMLRLGRDRDHLRVVGDQVGGPTPAADIAGALIRVAEVLTRDPGTSGTYHFAGTPDVSWAEFAQEVFRRAELRVAVEQITTADYPTRAVRPGNSRLDCTGTTRTFGLPRPDWREGLDTVLARLNEAEA